MFDVLLDPFVIVGQSQLDVDADAASWIGVGVQVQQRFVLFHGLIAFQECGLPEIEKDEEHLLLWHYGRKSAVDRNDGMIRAVSDDGAVDIMPKLNIYTLFWYAKEDVSQTGDWIPLEKAVESLRGVRVSSTGSQLLAFYRMPVKLNFWDADERQSVLPLLRRFIESAVFGRHHLCDVFKCFCEFPLVFVA